MADYPIISDVSSYLVKLLRRKMCPEPIPSPNNIEVSSPAEQDVDYILGLTDNPAPNRRLPPGTLQAGKNVVG